MPLYVYEAVEPEKGCAKCRGGFEVSQSIKDDKLAACPDCGAKIQPHSKTDLHYRAKRAGFHSLKRVGKGEYEKMY